MTTATGFLKSVSGSKFIAVFVIDEISYNFAGNFSPSLEAFNSDSVTLTYNNTNELTSTRMFSGQVGTTNLKLTLMNGPVIQGPLTTPISTGSTLSGTGVWTQN